jgi:hypothetical protein
MSQWFCLVVLLGLLLSSCSGTRPLRPTDINVPEGFQVEVAANSLAAPTMIAFDEHGRMLIAESAYGGGGEPKVTRIESNGEKTVLAQGRVFGTELPITSVAFHDGQVYVVHAGTVGLSADMYSSPQHTAIQSQSKTPREIGTDKNNLVTNLQLESFSLLS